MTIRTKLNLCGDHEISQKSFKYVFILPNRDIVAFCRIMNANKTEESVPKGNNHSSSESSEHR